MVSHTKKTYKIRYNSRYNTLGRKIQLYLLLFQIGLIVAGLILYFLNKNGITKKFLDLVLLPINFDDDSHTIINSKTEFKNTNKTTNKNTFEDVEKVDVSENIYDPRYFSDPKNAFLSPVTDQDVCGTCNFFAHRSQLSDNINKKNKLYNYTKDCSENENVLISAQDLIDKYLRVIKNGIDFKTYCKEGGSNATELINIIEEISVNPNYLIEESCNSYKLPKTLDSIKTLKAKIADLETLKLTLLSQETTTDINNELTIEEIDTILADLKVKLKLAKQKKIILIGLIVLSSILLVLFGYYTSKFTDTNIIKTFITYLSGALSLIFIILSVILLSNKIRDTITALLNKYEESVQHIYINFFLGCFITISSLNIIHTIYNLYNYYYANYTYSKHEHIFTIIIMCVSSFLIYFLDTNRRKINQTYKDKHEAPTIESFQDVKYNQYLCYPACKNIYKNKRQFTATTLYKFDDDDYNKLSGILKKKQLKKLLKTHGGFVGAIDLYNKDYFRDQTRSIKSNPYYYIPPLNESKPTGAHAMHVIGWVNLTKKFIYDIEGKIKEEYKNYTTVINQLFTTSFNEPEINKEGEYWIVKNSWGISSGEGGYLYIRMYDGISDPSKNIITYLGEEYDNTSKYKFIDNKGAEHDIDLNKFINIKFIESGFIIYDAEIVNP